MGKILSKLVDLLPANYLFDKFKDLLKDGVTANEFKLRMKELEIEEDKIALEDFANKKDLLTRIFHKVYPLGILVIIIMYSGEYYVNFSSWYRNGDFPDFEFVPRGFEIMCLSFTMMLMSKKVLEVIGEVIVKYLLGKLDRLDRRYKGD